MRQNIEQHEGKKYLRTIYPCGNTSQSPIQVDVYEVLKAFNVTCPAIQHCIKKLLCAGLRDKGDKVADLTGAMAALNRAIDFAERQTCSVDSQISEDLEKPDFTYKSINPIPEEVFSSGDLIMIRTNQKYTLREYIETPWGSGKVIQHTTPRGMTGVILTG